MTFYHNRIFNWFLCPKVWDASTLQEVHEMQDLHHWVRALALDTKRVSSLNRIPSVHYICTFSVEWVTLSYLYKALGLLRAGKFSSHKLGELTNFFLLTANATDFLCSVKDLIHVFYHGYTSKKSQEKPRACLTVVTRNIDPWHPPYTKKPFLNLLRKQNLFPRRKKWRFFSGTGFEAYAIRHFRNNVSTTMY